MRERGLRIDGLLPLPVRRNNLLRHWIRRQGEMPSRELLGLLWQEVALARDDANPRLSLQGLACRRYQGRLYLIAPRSRPREGRCHPDGRRSPCRTGSRAVQALENGWRSVADTEGGQLLSVRFQVAPGVMLKPVGRVGSRRLKAAAKVRGALLAAGRIPSLLR